MKKGTAQTIAKQAAKILDNPTSSKTARSLAGSALTQSKAPAERTSSRSAPKRPSLPARSGACDCDERQPQPAKSSGQLCDPAWYLGPDTPPPCHRRPSTKECGSAK